MSDENKAYAATPSSDLEIQIMSSVFPKNEREWWASREIERLRQQLTILQSEKECLGGLSIVELVNERDRLLDQNTMLKSEIGRPVKTRQGDGYVELVCQACEGRLPLNHIIRDFLAYCSEECAETPRPERDEHIKSLRSERDELRAEVGRKGKILSNLEEFINDGIEQLDRQIEEEKLAGNEIRKDNYWYERVAFLSVLVLLEREKQPPREPGDE